MPSLKDIRKRIGSVKKTQQITKAMKMVAAAKLRRSQDAIHRARPYAERLESVLERVAGHLGEESHPLLAGRASNRVELMVFSSDRGLCGGFNSNLFRAVERWRIDHPDTEITLNIIGRKGLEYFRRRNYTIRHSTVGIPGAIDMGFASEIARETVASFLAGDVDTVLLFYNRFINAISQQITTRQLLPVPQKEASGEALHQDYIFEPPAAEVLPSLVPLHIDFQVFAALLDSQASEYGARMSAMDSASRNASEAIERLTLHANRVRQASITRELVEITTGAEALHG